MLEFVFHKQRPFASGELSVITVQNNQRDIHAICPTVNVFFT